MNASDTVTTAPEASTEDATLEAVKDRLRYAVEFLCAVEGHCSDVVRTVYDRSRGLDLGTAPNQRRFDTSFEITAAGKTVVKTGRHEAYSQRAADWLALNLIGLAPDDPEPLDSSNDSDAVKAYKEEIYALAEESTNSINRNTLNKYLRLMGVRELPTQRTFEFQIELAPPSTHATYTTVAYTAEEALTIVQQQLEVDARRLRDGSNRQYAKGLGLAQRPPVEGAELVLIEPAPATA